MANRRHAFSVQSIMLFWSCRLCTNTLQGRDSSVHGLNAYVRGGILWSNWIDARCYKCCAGYHIHAILIHCARFRTNRKQRHEYVGWNSSSSNKILNFDSRPGPGRPTMNCWRRETFNWKILFTKVETFNWVNRLLVCKRPRQHKVTSPAASQILFDSTTISTGQSGWKRLCPAIFSVSSKWQ